MARAWIRVLAAALVSFGGVAAADDKASGTVTIESKSVLLRNQNGVVLELTSTQTGVKFTLAGEGIEVKLK
jgi:hypothetical protein